MIALVLMLIPGMASAQKRPRHLRMLQQMLAVQVALDRAGFSPGEIDGRGGPKTRLALSQFQKSASLQPTGVVNEETLGALARFSRAHRELHDHAAGCRGPVHRRDAGRHDGKRQVPGICVHIRARSARRKISCEPRAAENAQSRCGVGGRRHDQSAGRRAIRAAIEGGQTGSDGKAGCGCQACRFRWGRSGDFGRDEIARRARLQQERF